MLSYQVRWSWIFLWCVTVIVPTMTWALESVDRNLELKWTTRDGDDWMAGISGIARGQSLLMWDGKMEYVPLDRLCGGDVDWIRELMTREGTFNRFPKRDLTSATVTDTDSDDENPFESDSDSASITDEQPGVEEDGENPFQADEGSSMSQEPEASVEDENPFEESKNENPDNTVRDWTDKNGKTVTGSLQSVEGEQAVIQSDKKILRVPLAGFSQKDLEWIVGDFRKRGKLAQLPKKYHSINRPFADKKVAGLSDSRLWVDSKGRSTEAKFMSVKSSGEEIQLLGSRFFDVPLSMVSREDLIWLQSALREEGRLTELPLPYRDPIDPSISGAELSKYRKTKFFRKWSLINRETATAQWQHMEKGEVHLIMYDTKESVQIPYENLSKADKTYVRERLEFEMPGELFPETTVTETTPEQTASGFQIWTDLDGNRISGRFVRSDKSSSVHIIETSEGEKAYIAAFFSNEDRAAIDGARKQQNTLAGTPSATSAMSRGYSGTNTTGMSSRASAAQSLTQQSQQRQMDMINQQNATNDRLNSANQAINQQVAQMNQQMQSLQKYSANGGAFGPTGASPEPVGISSPRVAQVDSSSGGQSAYAAGQETGQKVGQIVAIALPFVLLVAWFVIYQSK